MLIAREDERMALEREYERDQASFVVVYGRRRICLLYTSTHGVAQV